MAARLFIFLFALHFLFLCEMANAKGPTVQISVTGPDISAPIHSSDESVTAVNVWFTDYLDWDSGSIAGAIAEESDYIVHFWVRPPHRPIQLKYVVQFRWESQLDRAVNCLPGEESQWYWVNTQTIYHEAEGNCYYAEKEWGNAVNSLLPENR